MLTYNPPRYLFRRHTILHNLNGGNRFLEIGAGNLKLSHELTNFYDKGLAVDFEPGVKKLLNYLPSKTQDKLSVRIGDFFSLKTSGELFDCIVACEVMEHIEDDRDFLNKIYKKLKPGGQVIISVPAKDKYWTIHDDVAGHFRRYHKDQLIKLFSESGFDNVTVRAYGYPFVNLLRYLRAIHGKRQAKSKLNWSNTERTKKSGIGQVTGKYGLVSVLVNPITFWPLNIISSLFDNFDLSEAYVVVATK